MALDAYRTMRFELFEVWEDGKGEFPLFVTSDAVAARVHVEDNPGDTMTRRWWVREGNLSVNPTPPGETK